QQNALRVLYLEEVLHLPGNPGIGRVAALPRERFEEVVPADLDVGGHEVGDLGIGSSEHQVLTRSFQVVVDELDGARDVVDGYGLGILTVGLEIGEVGEDNRYRSDVEVDAAH